MATSCWGRPSAFPQISSCDVPAPTEQDFQTPGKKALVFLKAFDLSAILEKVNKISLGQSQVVLDDMTKLVDQLCSWVQNLPQELRLFDSDNTRQPFWRPSAELHIWYLAIVILLQLLDKDGFPWKIAPSSLVAASCIARLYEEIDCREETVHLLHIHGLFCMLAAVPLICYSHTSQETRATCEEDVDIICRILHKMRCRYGGADLVLTKIRHLQEETRRDRETATHRQLEDFVPHMPATGSIRSRVGDLFPFPRSFCSALDLVGQEMHTMEALDESHMLQMEDGFSPLSYDHNLSLATLLAMDCTAIDLGFGNDGFGLDISIEP